MSGTQELQSSLPSTVDEYLSRLPQRDGEALQRLREVIKGVAPDATERIAYGIPVFAFKKDLVGIGVRKQGLSFYTMSPALVSAMEEELTGCTVSGATIYFTPDRPLSESLVERIVRARVDELGLG